MHEVVLTNNYYKGNNEGNEAIRFIQERKLDADIEYGLTFGQQCSMSIGKNPGVDDLKARDN